MEIIAWSYMIVCKLLVLYLAYGGKEKANTGWKF